MDDGLSQGFQLCRETGGCNTTLAGGDSVTEKTVDCFGKMKNIHIIIQVFDDVGISLEEIDGYILIGSQTFCDGLQFPKILIQSALPKFIVPPEDADRRKTDGEVCLRVGGDPLLQQREILRKEGIDLPDRSLFLDMGRWRVAVYDLTGMKGLGLIPAVGISLVVVQYKGVG